MDYEGIQKRSDFVRIKGRQNDCRIEYDVVLTVVWWALLQSTGREPKRRSFQRYLSDERQKQSVKVQNVQTSHKYTMGIMPIGHCPAAQVAGIGRSWFGG